MKILGSFLHRALELPTSIASRRRTLPILACAHMEAKGGSLTIQATDLDQSATTICECEGDLSPFCVNLSTMAGMLTGPTGTLELSLSAKNKRLVCKDGSITEVPVLDAAEFPLMFTDKIKGIGVNCTDLAKAIKAVKWAASKNEYQYMLMSVHIVATPKFLMVEATNGRQLAQYSPPAIASPFECVIPIGMAGTLADCLEADGATFWLSDKRACVKSKSGEYSTKLIEGNFPGTTSVTGLERTLIGSFASGGFRNIFQRIVQTAKDANTTRIDTVLKFGQKKCEVSVNSETFKFDGSVDGKFAEKEAQVNAIPFLECINAFPEDSTIKLAWVDQQKAFALECGNLLVITSQPMTK